MKLIKSAAAFGTGRFAMKLLKDKLVKMLKDALAFFILALVFLFICLFSFAFVFFIMLVLTTIFNALLNYYG